jgi:hypothetical protein
MSARDLEVAWFGKAANSRGDVPVYFVQGDLNWSSSVVKTLKTKRYYVDAGGSLSGAFRKQQEKYLATVSEEQQAEDRANMERPYFDAVYTSQYATPYSHELIMWDGSREDAPVSLIGIFEGNDNTAKLMWKRRKRLASMNRPARQKSAGAFSDYITPPSLNWDKIAKDFGEAHHQWYNGLTAYEEVMEFIAKGAKRDGPEYKGVVALAERGMRTARKLLDQQNAIQDDLYSMQSEMPRTDED